MSWPLLQLAIDAEDAASGLKVFLDEVPSKSTDISVCMGELFGISSALRALHHALDYSRFGRYTRRINSDVELVLPSLQFTLKEVRVMFADAGPPVYTPGGYRSVPDYRHLWEDLAQVMKEQGPSLASRLEVYRIFIQIIYDILRGERSGGSDLDRFRTATRRLLRNQEALQGNYGRLPLDAGQPTRPPMPDRRQSIQSYYTVSSYPPPAPEVPLSPTSSSSSGHTYFSGDSRIHRNSNAPGQLSHWATFIFDGQHPVSPLHYHGEATKCLGRDEPSAIKMLQDDGFLRVLQLPFEATDVWVRLYWRPNDHRARILFLTKEHGIRYRYCIPLTALKVLRTESTLQLCRVNQEDGELDLWANLKFPCYERMVLFYCTVVAMKRQDWVKPHQGLEDFIQPGEEEEFGGEIEDDRFLHAFRIFRDTDSGGVRFEATARRGPMKKCPIWTAFVTSYIGSRTWMRRVSATTVQLRELKPYVFCDNYTPYRGPSGKFELKFTSVEDAEEFMETFHKIRVR